MSHLIGRGRYGRETYPRGSNGGGAQPPGMVAPVDSIVAASASRLADLNAAGLVDGTFVYVRDTVHDVFDLDKNSALVVDNIEVVAAIGGGQWLRRNEPWLGWLFQAEWWIDPVTGDDENDGLTALTALASHAEFERRIGTNELRVAVTVHIVGSSDAITVPQSALGLGAITYVGETITPPLLSGTLSAASPSDPATNFQQTVTAAGLGAFARKRIRLTANNACANILADLGGDEVRTTTFLIYPAITIYDPVGDEDFVVEDLPTTTQINAYADTASDGKIVIDNIRAATIVGTGVSTTRCEIRNHISRGLMQVIGNFGIAQAVFDGDRFTIEGGGSFQFTFMGANSIRLISTPGALRAAYVTQNGPLVVGIVSSPLDGTTQIQVGNTVLAGSSSFFKDTGALATFGAGLQVRTGAIVHSIFRIYGDSNPQVDLGGSLFYLGAAAKPTSGTGATIAGTAYAYAQLPVALSSGGFIDSSTIQATPTERVQVGIGTLVDGVVTVGGVGGTIYVTANSTFDVTPIGGAGLALGELTIDAAPVVGAPGVGAFTVRSLDAAGALVDDDRSFYYRIFN